VFEQMEEYHGNHEEQGNDKKKQMLSQFNLFPRYRDYCQCQRAIHDAEQYRAVETIPADYVQRFVEYIRSVYEDIRQRVDGIYRRRSYLKDTQDH
jgi:hypothetical protein